jgi:hypothetical protein
VFTRIPSRCPVKQYRGTRKSEPKSAGLEPVD